MTDPPATKGDRTRRRLLDAAAAQLARTGYDGVSLTVIADAAGLRPGSVYFHFSSKEDLLAAVLEEGLVQTLRYLGEALAAVPDADDPAARLDAAICAHLTAIAELRDYAAVVTSPRLAVSTAAAPAFHRLRRRYLAQWRRLIADGQAAGVVPADVRPRTLQVLLLGALNAGAAAGCSAAETATAAGALLGLPVPAR